MKKVCLTIVLLFCLLVGCSQQLKIDDYIDEVKENSTKTVAEQYVLNLLVQEKLLTSNSRAVSTTELSFFETIEIEDKNGTKISYSDLSEEDKVLFVNDWYKETVQQLQEKINKNKTKKIYCSHLCYLAWKDVSEKYTLDTGVWVKPADLISSRYTTIEETINNTYTCAEDYE